MRPKSAFSIHGPAMTLCDVIRCGYFQQVRLLVEMGLNIEQTDIEEKSPLILCAFVEPESWGCGIGRILIENGARVSTQDKYGLNAFHYVCIYGRFQLAKILLNAIDFDLNQIDRYGNTALHYAVKSGNSMITKLIVQCLKRYTLPLDVPNRQSLSSVQLAYKLNHLSCINILEDDDTFDTPCEDTNLVLGFENKERKQFRRCQRECCRSAPVFGRNDFLNKTVKSTKPNKRNPEKIINCASVKDFRNTPENIFKLTALPCDNYDTTGEYSATIRRPKSAFVSRQVPQLSDSPYSWRDGLRSLYLNYEFQCTPSWRRPVKPLEIKIEAPSIEEDENEKLLKDRRGRRPSSTFRLNIDFNNQRRRSSFSPKNSRKGSTSNDKRSPMGDNASIASSNESVSSLTPRSKKDVSPKSPKHLEVEF